MNKSKIAIMTTLLGSVLGLSACQVTPEDHGIHRDRDYRYHNIPRGELTPEQRARWEAQREHRQDQRDYRQDRREHMRENRETQRAQIEKACRGKRVGERVTFQWNNRTIEGKCEVRFNPDKSPFKR